MSLERIFYLNTISLNTTFPERLFISPKSIFEKIKNLGLSIHFVQSLSSVSPEINKELSQDEKEDASWIEKCRNGYAALVTELKEGKKKIDKERAKRDALQKKVDERQILLDEIKIKKEPEVETNKSTKQVSPIELHEYESINESCSSRLVNKTHTKEELAEWAKFYKNQYQEIIKDAQRKRSLAKQGDRT
ncbi:1249_t:CDS:2 [Rhizophagus irregularis]|nr:1249_t:CDS:2 [Rhizophagus irregularis]